MIPLAGVIAALKVGGTPFKFVGGAADLVSASDNLKIFPSAFVLPLSDGAGANRIAAVNAVSQLLAERFGVMVSVRNVRDGTGEKAQEDLRVAIEWTRLQLVGFSVSAERDLVELEGGEMVSFTDEILIWNDRYITTRDLRKV